MDAQHNGKRARRSFSPEFKAQTVELARHGGKGVPEVARHLDLAHEVAVPKDVEDKLAVHGLS